MGKFYFDLDAIFKIYGLVRLNIIIQNVECNLEMEAKVIK